MRKRVTISLDDDVIKKLRIIQAKNLVKLMEHVSFSSVLNNELRKAINQVE